jgi:methyl-accepting chemotaxis protein
VKLERKFILAVIVLVSMLLVVFTAQEYRQAGVQYRAALQRNADDVGARLQLSLPGLLWNFENDSVRKTAIAEVNSDDVLAIEIMDANGKTLMQLSKNVTGDIQSELPVQASSAEAINVPLAFVDGKKTEAVGSLRIWVNDASVLRNMRALLERSLVRLLVMDVLLVLLIYMVVGRLVTRPLNNMLSHVQQLAEGDGDLTRRINVQTSDEIGHLAAQINEFVKKLHGLIGDTLGQTARLNAAAAMTKQAVDELQKPVQQQSTELEDLAHALKEMTLAGEHIARHAATASAQMSTTREKANGGLVQIRRASEASGSLAAEISASASQLQELAKEVNEVGAILDVIQGIADQTNLLALNAAIEAARAGEQGRGFAVVADEVRTLASRTRDSTGNIRQMIERLQQRTQDSVQRMAASQQRAEASVDTTMIAGDAFTDINKLIEVVGELNFQIAAATEEQSATLVTIDGNVAGMRQVYDSTVAAARLSAESERQLSDVRLQLNSLLGKFQV